MKRSEMTDEPLKIPGSGNPLVYQMAMKSLKSLEL